MPAEAAAPPSRRTPIPARQRTHQTDRGSAKDARRKPKPRTPPVFGPSSRAVTDVKPALNDPSCRPFRRHFLPYTAGKFHLRVRGTSDRLIFGPNPAQVGLRRGRPDPDVPRGFLQRHPGNVSGQQRVLTNRQPHALLLTSTDLTSTDLTSTELKRRMRMTGRHLMDGLAELGVAGEGLFLVPTGHGVVAERRFGVAESAVGMRLLVGVADPARQRESIVVPSPGLGRFADGQEDLAEQVECFGEQGELSGLVADEHGPFQVLAGGLAAGGPELELAQVDEGARLAVLMAIRAEPGECLPELGLRLTVLALAQAGQGEVTGGKGLVHMVAGVLADGHALFEFFGGLSVAALQQVEVAQVAQGGREDDPFTGRPADVCDLLQLAGRLRVPAGVQGNGPQAEQPADLEVLAGRWPA